MKNVSVKLKLESSVRNTCYRRVSARRRATDVLLTLVCR